MKDEDPAGITIVLEIDDELYTRLLILANKEGMSTGDFARLALSNYLKGEL